MPIEPAAPAEQRTAGRASGAEPGRAAPASGFSPSGTSLAGELTAGGGASGRRASRAQRLAQAAGGAATLALLTVLAHFGSLHDGLFFDDHWHRHHVLQANWTPADLTNAAAFDLPGELANLWWQERPIRLQYVRPLAMAVLKAEYALTGGDPRALHALSMVWHWLSGLAVFALAGWALQSRLWGLVAAAFFIIHPHSVFAVGWIAAQNALLGTLFLVLAAWLYMRSSLGEEPSTPLRRRCLLAAALLLAAAALFCRESAIVFPGLALLIDFFGRGWRYALGRWPVHAVILGLALGYVIWRVAVFPDTTAPDFYVTLPRDWQYVLWASSKLMQLLFSLVFYSPMLAGLAEYRDFTPGEIGTHLVMLLGLSLIALWYLYASRGVRLRWFWPAWVVAAFLPVIPVFTMPHFAHLPAAGLAIMTAACLRRVRGWWRWAVGATVVLATLFCFGTYRYLWRGVLRAEQLITSDMIFNSPPPAGNATIFFINLPAVGLYSAATLREAWNRPDLQAYVLTLAPHPLAMQSPGVVEVLGERVLRVSLPPPGYFSGTFGRMLNEGLRYGPPLRPGDVVAGREFDTTVEQADEHGVTALRFTFRKPLSSPDYRFYVSSWVRPAWWREFDRRPTDLPEEALRMFAAARSPDAGAREPARALLRQWARVLLLQDASPLLREAALLDDDLTDAELDRLEAWCRAEGGTALLKEREAWRAVSRAWKRERKIFFFLQQVAGQYVRSDLLLTDDD